MTALMYAPSGTDTAPSGAYDPWVSAEDVGAATAAVAGVDLSRVMHRLRDEGPNRWSESCLAAAERDYRGFLALQILYPGMGLVPSPLIDAVWHRHILDTRKYHADCATLFGRYLHHNPNFGTGGEAEQQELRDGFDRTRRLWEATFGTRLPDVLPPECSDTQPRNNRLACTDGGGGE